MPSPLPTPPSLSLPFLLRSHALLITTGAARSPHASTRLISLLLHPSLPASPALSHAAHILDAEHHSSPLLSTRLLHSLLRRLTPSDALSFFSSHLHPFTPRISPRALPIVIAAAKLLPSLSLGESLHALALKLGFMWYLPVPNSLLHLYASCDALDLGRQLFDEMPHKDRVSYNSFVDGLVKSGDLGDAETLFWMTPDRNVVSWSNLFNGFVRNRMFHKGVAFFHRMIQQGVDPDDTTVVSLLSVYSHFKLALHGRAVHGFLTRKWSSLPTHISSALVGFYCKCTLLDSAMEVFGKTLKKDLICWNTLISRLGSNGRGEEALAVFSQMLHDGVKPDDSTFIGVLVACAHSGLVDEAHQYIKMMTKDFDISPSFAHYWCLVDLFVRVGNPCYALKVIQEMPLDSESAIWGAVIWLARVHGDISVGEYLGKQLIELEPDNSRRYVPLVNVYAAASRWDKYKEIQEKMKAKGLKKLPDCTLLDLNVVVHKFDVGDASRPENEKVYEVLQEVAKQLNLRPCREGVKIPTASV